MRGPSRCAWGDAEFVAQAHPQFVVHLQRLRCVVLRRVRLEAQLVLDSAAECVRFEQESLGALHQMLSGLDSHARAAAWTEIAHQLSAYEAPGGDSSVLVN